LLDRVVGEMDHRVFYVEKVEIAGGGSDVALPMKICSDLSVEASDDHVVPDVEFPSSV
jgi:hypothetical protein